MARAKIFVSFSSQDREFVAKLFFRLHAQPVELWDYSQEGHEIPGGRDVMEYLRGRIETCDVFLPVVSPNSFSSNYARREVDYALGLARAQRRLLILPFVSAECVSATNWPAPYAELAGLRYYVVTISSENRTDQMAARTSMEMALRRLCQDLGVEYARPALEDPRLPFMERFDAELKSFEHDHASFRDTEHQIAIYRRLLDARNEVENAIAVADFEAALTRINYFLATCEYEIPRRRFYYPYLVKVICLISGGQLWPAYEILKTLLEHERLDENVFAALACVRHLQGNFAEALSYYRAAAQLDPNDPAAKHGILLNALLSRAEVNVDELLTEIEQTQPLVSEDATKVLVLKAFAYAATGRPGEAIRIYEQLLEREPATSSVLLNFADVLADNRVGQAGRAAKLLEDHRAQFGKEAEYLHRLASLRFSLDQKEKALADFEELIRLHPGVRQYHADATRVCWECGRGDRARQIAATLLDLNRFPLPSDGNDFFCDGLANWILSRSARADYDFERSSYPPQDHYRNLLRI